MRLKAHHTRTVLIPPGEPIFSGHGFTVELEDEAGGLFIRVTNNGDETGKPGLIFDPEEWQDIKEAVAESLLTIAFIESGE